MSKHPNSLDLVQEFHDENFEFVKELFKLIAEIPDSEFEDKTYWEQHTSAPVQNLLRFIEAARKQGHKTDEQASQQS